MTGHGRRSTTTWSCAIASASDARPVPPPPCWTAKASRRPKRAVCAATMRARRSKVASGTPWWTPTGARSSSTSARLTSRIATAPCRCYAPRVAHSPLSSGSSPIAPTRASGSPTHAYCRRDRTQDRRADRVPGPQATLGGRAVLRLDRAQSPLLPRCRKAHRIRRSLPLRRFRHHPAATPGTLLIRIRNGLLPWLCTSGWATGDEQ